MAYNGSVELLSGIKQVNNGNYPLVDASAVYVEDGVNLRDALGQTTSFAQLQSILTSTLENLEEAILNRDISTQIAILDYAILDMSILGTTDNKIAKRVNNTVNNVTLAATGASSVTYANGAIEITQANNVSYDENDHSIIIT